MARQRVIERILTKEREPGRGRELRRGLEFLAMLSYVPPSRLHPWYRSDLTDMRWLPINEDLDLPESAPTPLALLDRLIDEASHRVIYEACGCRKANECENHPVDIGCLLLGDSAVESPPSVSREVGPVEAKEHARRAIEAGLVPQVGKARIDNYYFGIKDRRRMLTCCFCCDCCCISRYQRFAPVDYLDELFPRLDGIRMEVTSACDGCPDGPAECVERCYVQAMAIEDGRAVISDKCRACGRCALVCPAHAIDIRIEDERFLEISYERIRAHVDHT